MVLALGYGIVTYSLPLPLYNLDASFGSHILRVEDWALIGVHFELLGSDDGLLFASRDIVASTPSLNRQ